MNFYRSLKTLHPSKNFYYYSKTGQTNKATSKNPLFHKADFIFVNVITKTPQKTHQYTLRAYRQAYVAIWGFCLYQ